MDYHAYREKYFVEPAPAESFETVGVLGATLFIQDYELAVDYYTSVLGPPGYVEGEGTRGWRLGNSWLTLLRGQQGNPRNVEVNIVMESPEEAERMQRAFIEAGGVGPAPSDQLMYEPVRMCPVTDPFGTALMIFAPL
jgi:hypothetical protein